MPILVIAVVSLVLFLIMGAMCVSAVLSERRFEREVQSYKTAPPAKEVPGVRAARAGR
jgi:Na+-transporting methylmalonyl-CoA/oxaloacetate decarboxylase gamma subunit